MQWIKTHLKKLLAILGLTVLGASASMLGGDVEVDKKIDMEKELIRIEKEQEKLEKGKYKYKPKYEKDGLTYEIHEYVTPKGEIGYQVFINGENFNKSIGYGVEGESRTWEFQIDTNTATTTL